MNYDPFSGRGYQTVRNNVGIDSNEKAFRAGIARRKRKKEKEEKIAQEERDKLAWEKYIAEVKRLDAIEYGENE